MSYRRYSLGNSVVREFGAAVPMKCLDKQRAKVYREVTSSLTTCRFKPTEN
jgi:hypothetical protein